MDHQRIDYVAPGLRLQECDPDPFVQFQGWFAAAEQAGVVLPDAMTLATASASGAPSARVVLLRGVDHGLVFYTNYQSRKGEEISNNPQGCLMFYWQALHRQVRVDGNLEQVGRTASEAYFATRPRGSQLSAWVSTRQSGPCAGRGALEEGWANVEGRFPDEVPCPPDWGGYRLIPTTFEFWQGRPDRLHDRIEYRQDDAQWIRRRLQP